MPQRIVEHIKKDRALKKAVTYRIIAAGGALIISGLTWFLSGNVFATVVGGWAFGEGFRTIAFYFHERAYEKWDENNGKTIS